MPAKRLFHVAINSTDLDRSLAFYERLGFRALSDREVHNPAVKEAFGVASADLRFVHLRMGDGEEATLLDIVQWRNPDTTPAEPIRDQMQRGMTRFAVLTDSTDRVHQELREAGATLLTEPTTVMTPQGGWRICLAQDPDGVVVQVTELVPAEN